MSPSFFQKKSFICLDTTELHAWIYESRWAATLCFRSSLQPEKYLRSWNIKNVWQAEARGGKQKECQVDRRPMHFKKQTLMSDKEMLKRCHYRLTSASKRIRHNRWQYISIAARHRKATLFWFAYTIYEFDGLNEKMVLRVLKTFNFRMKRDRLTMYFDKNFEHFKLSFPLHVLSWKKEHLTQRKLRLQFSVYGALLFLSCLRHTLDEEKKNLLAFWCHTLLFSIRDHCPTLSSVERWLAFQCIYFKVAKHFAISDHSEPYTRIFFSLINSRQVWD